MVEGLLFIDFDMDKKHIITVLSHTTHINRTGVPRLKEGRPKKTTTAHLYLYRNRIILLQEAEHSIIMMPNHRLQRPLLLVALALTSLLGTYQHVEAFSPSGPTTFCTSRRNLLKHQHWHVRSNGPTSCFLTKAFLIVSEEDDDDDDDDIEPAEANEPIDPYTQKAASEFEESIIMGDQEIKATPVSDMDWGGALGSLRQRTQDIESGKSSDPSHALFRLLSSQSPNQAIGTFVSRANPQVVTAMSGAVSSLLGGLANPMMGAEMVVKASGDKVASLCFQLQMTGYMFRNAEYVMALKDLMNIRKSATIDEYREAFENLDTDGSGFIETDEIKDLLDNVYNGKTPSFEVQAFLKFFDTNKDGRISWSEFERGLGSAMAEQNQIKSSLSLLLPPSDEEEDDIRPPEPEVTGEIEIELEDGSIVTKDAKEYIEELRKEAEELKLALRREKFGSQNVNSDILRIENPSGDVGGLASYIASRQGDVKALTENISPEIVETMKKLVDYVLEGGVSQKGKRIPREEMEMEIPAPALQQLALWQLILGYQLRESEAKGEYMRLLE